MSLNIVDISAIVLIVLTCIVGYVRGIMFSILRFLRAAVGMCFCFYFSSYYSYPIYERFVKPGLVDSINEKIAVTGNIDEIITNLNNYIDSMPDYFAGYFNVSNIDISSDDIAQSILLNVFEPVAVKLTKIVVFIAVFMIFFTATGIIIFFMKRKYDKDKKEGKRAKLKTADKVIGLVFGLLKGLLILFCVFSAVSFLLGLTAAQPDTESTFRNAFEGSISYNYFSNINPFNAITEGLL